VTKINSIDVGMARPDGILFDDFRQRIYVFSHQTKDATVIDSKEGSVLGTIDLGGVPEQDVVDGKGSVSSSCCVLSVRISFYLWLLSLFATDEHR
jgi:hypothetical protein